MKFETDEKCEECIKSKEEFESLQNQEPKKYYRLVVELAKDVTQKKWHIRDVKKEGEYD